MENNHVKLVMQFNSFKTLADGGLRLTLDSGIEGLGELQKLLQWTKNRDVNLAVAIVPISKDELEINSLMEP